jgi:hypothetical protein
MLIGEVMLIARFYCKLVNAWDLSAYAYLVRYAYLQYAYSEFLLYSIPILYCMISDAQILYCNNITI